MDPESDVSLSPLEQLNISVEYTDDKYARMKGKQSRIKELLTAMEEMKYTVERPTHPEGEPDDAFFAAQERYSKDQSRKRGAMRDLSRQLGSGLGNYDYSTGKIDGATYMIRVNHSFGSDDESDCVIDLGGGGNTERPGLIKDTINNAATFLSRQKHV